MSGFDLIIGNPPFVNVIEGGIDKRSSNMHAFLKPKLGGTADLAARFLAFSLDIVSDTGALAYVQPRATLNTPALNNFRSDLGRGFLPSMIYAPDNPHLFQGAAVFVCLLTLAKAQNSKVSIGDNPASIEWQEGLVSGENWWLAIQQIAGDLPELQTGGTPIGDLFDVQSSMTTGDAYDVKPFIYSDKEGDDLKLITTGLIDPDTCFWGQEKCRYLKDDYMHPRVPEDASLSNSLKKRLKKSRRPKILVAGLSSRIECFVDELGEYIGAVSTFSIYHDGDDVDELKRLAQFLLSDPASAIFRAVLGANAMGGGNTTMKKGFLLSLNYLDNGSKS